MNTNTSSNIEFLDYLDTWQADLPAKMLAEIAPDPARALIVVVDMIEGFCHFGPLASPRVAAIIDSVTGVLKAGWEHGIRHILLTQDSHEPDAVEFGAFPPHCIKGTPEAETIQAIKDLPFFGQMVQVPKNSISSDLRTDFQAWLDKHPEIDTFIVTGDCTDLCIYQLAMHLRLDANALQLNRRVIVPASGVDTYDRPVAAARAEGGLPHAGDLLHKVFLYHMALNGVEVISDIQ